MARRAIVQRTALLLVASSTIGVAACKCQKNRDEGSTAQGLGSTIPAEVESEVALRNPDALLDKTLALVRKFIALPVDKNTLVGLTLQRAGLPGGLAGAFNLQRPIWLLGLDDKKLREPTPSLVVLPIRSKQALQSALDVQMKRAGTDGELSIFVPQTTSPQLAKLKLWIGDTHAVIASSRPAFDAAKHYLRATLLQRKPTHDLQVLLLRHDTTGAEAKRTLEKLKAAVSKRTGSGNAKLEEAISALLLRYGEVLTTTPRLEIAADLEGTDVTLKARADSTAGSELAQTIKQQKTGQPFAMDMIPAQTWAVLGVHDLPGDKRSSLLAGFFHQMADFFPLARRERFAKALSVATEHFGGSLTVALHRAIDGGLGVLVLSRVDEPAKALAAVNQAANLVTEWADQQAKATGSKTKISERAVACGQRAGRMFQVPLTEQPTPDSASLLPQLLGDSVGVGWLFGKNVGVFALGRSVQKQLELCCAQLQGDKMSTFADSVAFKRALGKVETRSGVFYLSLIDLVRALQGRGIPALEPLIAAVRGKKVERAISANWGVDDGRRALTANLRLPLGNLLLFKPLFDALGPGGAGAIPGLSPAP